MKSNTKTLSLIAGIFTGLALLYLIASSFGLTSSFFGWDARHSSWLWKIGTIILLAAATYLAFGMATGNILITSQMVILFAVLLVAAFMCSTGFKGTAGDIKQRVTYLTNLGKVSDTTLLYNCYEEFYHFNDHPELKEYIRTYNELPGRNLWNSYILAGETPKSTAPRANEDFKWHTGAYEMDLKNKKCR